MTPETMREAPAEVQAEIRALFAAMDRMDERIAKDFDEIARIKRKTSANMAEIKAQLAKLQMDYK